MAQYAALAAAASLVIPVACTPENPEITDNIQDAVLNKTITAVGTAADFTIHDSLDVNNDNKADFDFFLDGGTYGPSVTFASCNIDQLNGSGAVLTSQQLFDGLNIPVAVAKTVDDTIRSSSTNFTDICYFGNKYNANVVGYAGGGDKYLGFKFTATDGTHFGWMKVNLASDYKSIVIKDVAYDKRPNTAIAVGAK